MTETPREKKSPPKASPPSSAMTRLNAFLALAALAASGFAVYQTQTLNRIQTMHQAALAQEQHQDKQTLSDLEKRIESDNDALQNRVEAIHQHINTTLAQTQFLQNDWTALKARYYLELAGINHQWSDDPQTTMALLQAADGLIKTLPDTGILPVRQAIAKEYAALQTQAAVDWTSLFSELDVAQGMVLALPFHMQSPPPSEEQQKPSPAMGFKQHFEKSMQRLSQLIIIHHEDTDVSPMLSKAHQSLIQDRVILNLDIARLALLQHRIALYQRALKQAEQLLKTNYPQDTPEMKALQSVLVSLQQQPIDVEKTTVNEALSRMNHYLSTKAKSKDNPS